MATFGRLRKEETKHNPNLRQGHVLRALSVNNTQAAQVIKGLLFRFFPVNRPLLPFSSLKIRVTKRDLSSRGTIFCRSNK